MASARRLAARVLALALVLTAGSGCRKPPAMRLTYRVDVALAYDGDQDAKAVVEACGEIVAQRLYELVGRRSARVSTQGQQLIVELAGLQPDDLEVVTELISTGGRLAFRLLDETATASVFRQVRADESLSDEGIAVYQEAAPDGLDADGQKKAIQSYYARIACAPTKYISESLQGCLARFMAWASRLTVSDHREVGFESVSQAAPDTRPVRFDQVGWRTVLMMPQAELTERMILDASVGQDSDEQYYLLVSFSPQGAARFEEVTGANVNRRFAIVMDGVVDSTPVIRQKIVGGKATITMGVGDPAKQLHDAKQLELAFRVGALPAPLQLTQKELLGGGPR